VTFNDTFYIICQLLEQLIILETIDLTANSLLKMTDQTIFFTFHMDRIGQPAKNHSPFKSESEEFICCFRNMPKHGKASRRIDIMHNIHMRLTRVA
jgi:hypothetical protein